MCGDAVTARLDALEQAREKATPGPWFAWNRGVGWHLAVEDPAGIDHLPGRPTLLPEGSRTDLGRAADAACIVAEHDAVPDLLAAVRGVLALHVPYGIYDHCGHDHSEASGSENGVYEIEDVGYVCADGLQYSICDHCCAGGWGGQTEACIEDHEHGAGLPICPTVAVLTAALAPAVGDA